MPFCKCFPCCKPEEKQQDFEEIDNFLIEYAKKTNRYKRKCSLFRPRVEYVVQWGHLNVTSKLEEFQLIPNQLTLDAFQEGLSDLTDINKQGHPQQSDGCLKSPTLSSTKQSEVHRQQDATEDKENDCLKGENRDIKPPTTADGKDEDLIEETPVPESEESKSSLLEVQDAKSKRSMTKSRLHFSYLPKIPWFRRKERSADQNKDNSSETVEMQQKKGKVNITEQDESKGLTDIKHAVLKGAIADRTLSLFRTEYTNTSGQNQTFTFQTERRTKSSVSVNVQKSCKIGGKISLGLKLPAPAIIPVSKSIDPLNVTGELSGEMQWTKSKTDTMEQEEVWSVNNTVNVEHNHTTTAELKVHEEEATATFKVKHTVMPIYSTSRKRELDSFPIYVIPKSELKKSPDKQKVIDVLSIFKDSFCDAFGKDCKAVTVNEENNYIEFTTEGVVKCVYQARQVIDVHTKCLAQSVETQTFTEDA